MSEYEKLDSKWIDEHRMMGIYKDSNGRLMSYFALEDLQNLLVPKREEVDQAYKDGYETGKQHTYYKGYLEGLSCRLQGHGVSGQRDHGGSQGGPGYQYS